MGIKDRGFARYFIFILIFNILPMYKTFAGAKEMKHIKELEEAEKRRPPEENIVVPKVEYKADSFRDPFQGYLKKEGEGNITVVPRENITLPSLNVQGIVWGSELPQAIINNKVVKIGDTIEEATVVEIKKDSIVVSFKGYKFTLSSPALINLEKVGQKFQGGQ